MNITSKYRSLSIQARAAAVANVVLNFIFIRIFGYVAAGYTTLACYILYSVGHYVVSKRILVAEGIEENLMDAGFLLACSAFLIGVSVICNLLFPYRNPAVCDSVRKCRPGVLETGTVDEYDGRHPQKVNQKKKEKENLHEYQYFNKRIKRTRSVELSDRGYPRRSRDFPRSHSGGACDEDRRN